MKDLRFFLLVSSLKSKGVDAAIFMRAHSSSRCCLTNDVLFFTEGRLFTGVAAGSFQDEAYRKLHRKDTQSSRSTVPNVAQAKQEQFNPTEITEMRPKRKSLSLSSLFRNLNIPSLFPSEQQNNIKVWDFPAKWNEPVFAQKINQRNAFFLLKLEDSLLYLGREDVSNFSTWGRKFDEMF